MTTSTENRAQRRSGFAASDLALIAVFAALIAVFALIPALFTVGAVPFALHLIVVLLAPLVLGAVRGAATMLLYLLVGVAGLPVFSGGSSGPAVLIGATGGYLVGWVVAALASGAIRTAAARRRPSKKALTAWLVVAALVGVLVIHVFGVAWFMASPNLRMSPGAALLATAPFLPFDVVKAVIAALLAVAVLSAFPRLMPASR
ncbi:biotin transporter BioY [Propionibacterium australiense]|uniref:Biotin transporter n=1 Tax=Propionibacterium australiense TaxID=119981 RepID=A0A383S9H9_9ACTN|nr:biotin transporter BioY [Propionibacterium australiense]RLP06766.1 biotin transporter BioY [Propionibacterium australiense]RLP06932.1 biotin transporter BioY [Propionibacterium australiense]SYZ34074.1 BioY protein [Propionibacterium australiense]VEH92128.1 Biotin ECF transporter S component BioY [Propionibacterium australiense]